MGCSGSKDINEIKDNENNMIITQQKLKMEEDIEQVEWNLEYIGEDFILKIPNYELLGKVIKPEGEIKFIYIFEHGLGRSLIYKNDFYPFILNLGGIIYACDHVGHGRSPGPRIGCTIQEIRDEIQSIIHYAKTENQNLPVILHGHSLGGLGIISYIIRNKEKILSEIDAAFFEAPWISDCPFYHIGCTEKACAACLDNTCPNCLFGCNCHLEVKEFKDGEEEPKWLNVKNNYKDFVSGGTGHLFKSALEEIDFVRENYINYNHKLPSLFLHGKCDKRVSYEGNETFVKLIKDSYPDSDISFVGFEKGTHTLLKSRERKNTLDVIVSFIKKHI